MTTDLDRLIEAVEAGEGNRNDGTLYRLFGDSWVQAWDVMDRGSLDAAVMLLEALLPEAIWGRSLDGSMWVSLSAKTVTVYGFYLGSSDSPARALLLATLRAYRSTREASHDD